MILWLIYILVDAVINWYWIEKVKLIPNYIGMTIVRGWFFVLVGITVPIHPETFWHWLLFTTCSFWVLFDLSLNLLRGKRLNYLGTNSFIDSLGRKYPLPFWIAKVSALFVTFYLIIK